MAEYVEKSVVLKKLNELQKNDPATIGRKQFAEGYFLGLDEAEIVINQAPLADVAPVARGIWNHLGGDEWCCTNCGEVIHTEGSWEKPDKKFCHECGARMGGVR